MINSLNWDKLSDKKIILIIILIFVPFFMFFLGEPTLWEADDSVRGDIAKEMFVNGDFMTTYFNHQTRFDKPPFVYWINVISYKILGISEFSTRFGSCVFAILNLILTYFIAKKLFNKKIAVSSVLILGTSFFYFINSQLFSVDSAFIFFISASLFCLYLGYMEKNNRALLLVGTSLGLGTLVKGPVIFLLVGLIFLIFLVINSWQNKKFNWKFLFNYYLCLGLIIGLIVPLFWYFFMIIKYQDAFVYEHFTYRMIKRFSDGIENHLGPWYYYFIVLFVSFIPWSLFIIDSLAFSWYRRLEPKIYFLLTWIAVVFIFFSFSKTKLPNYILPLMPVMAILIAYWFNELLFEGKTKLNFIRISIFHFLLILFFGFLAIKYWPGFIKNGTYASMMFFVINFMVASLLFFSLVINNIVIFILKKYHKSYDYLFYVILISAFLLLLISWVSFFVVSDSFKPAKYLSNKLIEQLSDDDLVVSSIPDIKGFPFYLSHPVLFIYDNNAIREILMGTRKSFILVDKLTIDYLNNYNINYHLLSEYGIGYLISN